MHVRTLEHGSSFVEGSSFVSRYFSVHRRCTPTASSAACHAPSDPAVYVLRLDLDGAFSSGQVSLQEIVVRYALQHILLLSALSGE